MDLQERLAQCQIDKRAIQKKEQELLDAIKKKDAKKDPHYLMRQYIKEHSNSYFNAKIIGHEGTHYVMVNLPYSNDNWTFAAFHWVEAFCKHFNRPSHSVYPIHHEMFDNRAGLYIKV